MSVRAASRPPAPLVAVAGVAALLAAIPLIYVVARTGAAGLDGIAAVWERPRVPMLVRNTITLGASVAVASLVSGIAVAVALTRVRLPAPRVFAALTALPLAVPSYLAAFGWLATFPTIHGFWPAWLVLTATTTPYVTLPVAAALRQHGAAHAELAYSLGHSRWRVFTAVTWPSIRSAAFAGTLLVFLYVIADFGGVSLFRYPVLSTAIHQAYGASFDRYYAAVLAAMLVLLALVVLWSERRVRSRHHFTVTRTAPGTPASSPAKRLLAMGAISLGPVLAIGVPVFALVVRLLQAQSVRETDLGRLTESAVTTLTVSVAGAVVAVMLAIPVATLAAKYRGRLATLIEGVSSLPLALPGIVVGLGLVYFSLRTVPAIYQTAVLLVVAYGIMFMPKAIGTIRAAMERVPAELENVATTLGYRPLAVWWKVTARLARPAAITAGLLVAVIAMKELPATIMLRPTGTNTLAIDLWTRTEIAEYGAAVPYALALLVIAMVPAIALAPRTPRAAAPTP